jgi:hypothetical protein
LDIGTVAPGDIRPLFIQYGGMEPEYTARICLSENAADDKIIFITKTQQHTHRHKVLFNL